MNLYYYEITMIGYENEFLISTDEQLEINNVVSFVIENSPFIGAENADKYIVRCVSEEEAKRRERQCYNEWYKEYLEAKERGEAVGSIPRTLIIHIEKQY